MIFSAVDGFVKRYIQLRLFVDDVVEQVFPESASHAAGNGSVHSGYENVTPTRNGGGGGYQKNNAAASMAKNMFSGAKPPGPAQGRPEPANDDFNLEALECELLALKQLAVEEFAHSPEEDYPPRATGRHALRSMNTNGSEGCPSPMPPPEAAMETFWDDDATPSTVVASGFRDILSSSRRPIDASNAKDNRRVRPVAAAPPVDVPQRTSEKKSYRSSAKAVPSPKPVGGLNEVNDVAVALLSRYGSHN